MRGLRELVFSTTNTCSARCRDCPVVPGADPPARLTFEEMRRDMDEVYAWGGLRLVVFTGGEALLLGRHLRQAIAHAASKGLFTRIVTNAYWATSRDTALQVLGELKALGLTEINISCDDYHQEFVPLENVKHANDAALEIGLPALLVHRRRVGGQITEESLAAFLGVALHRFLPGKENPDNNVISTAPNVPLDACDQDSAEHPWELPSDDRQWMGPCSSVLRSIVVSPHRNVHLCCGIAKSSIPELRIGSLDQDDLLTILQRGNQDLMANWLALEGPAAILAFVRDKDPTLSLPERYVSRCHLCNELFTRPEVRRVLRKYAAERGPALLLLRGALDWVGEDWAGASQASAQVLDATPA